LTQRYKHRCQLAVTSLYFTVCIITLLSFEEWLKELCNLYISAWKLALTKWQHRKNISCATENRWPSWQHHQCKGQNYVC